MRKLGFFLFLSLLYPTSLIAADDSFRCGNELISLDDTMYSIRDSCGEPYSTQIIGEKTQHRILTKKKLKIESSLYITEWVYEHGDGIYILTFEGSRLTRKEFVFQ